MPNLSFKKEFLWKDRRAAVPFFIVFLLSMTAFSDFSHAAALERFQAETVVGDVAYVVLEGKWDGFSIAQRGSLSQSARQAPLWYPKHCVVCVPPGSSAVLKDNLGQRVKLVGPVVYDVWLDQRRSYGREDAAFKEGTILQGVIHRELDGAILPVGDKQVATAGARVKLDPCFAFVRDTDLPDAGDEARALRRGFVPDVQDIDDPGAHATFG